MHQALKAQGVKLFRLITKFLLWFFMWMICFALTLRVTVCFIKCNNYCGRCCWWRNMLFWKYVCTSVCGSAWAPPKVLGSSLLVFSYVCLRDCAPAPFWWHVLGFLNAALVVRRNWKQTFCNFPRIIAYTFWNFVQPVTHKLAVLLSQHLAIAYK